MVFGKYYDMWYKHGVKLTSKLEITKDLLDKVNKQCELCDLIWAINAANQSNKSPAILSITAMDQIRKLSPLLLKHPSCKNYSGADEVEARAVRHFATGSEDRFKKRQPKISNALEGYINKNASGKNNNQSITESLLQGEIPTWEEIHAIYKKNAKSGEDIAPDHLKESIQNLFQEQERTLHPSWWEETKNILRNESEKQIHPDKTMPGKTVLRKKEL